eukprot:ctg_3250.g701
MAVRRVPVAPPKREARHPRDVSSRPPALCEPNGAARWQTVKRLMWLHVHKRDDVGAGSFGLEQRRRRTGRNGVMGVLECWLLGVECVWSVHECVLGVGVGLGGNGQRVGWELGAGGVLAGERLM